MCDSKTLCYGYLKSIFATEVLKIKIIKSSNCIYYCINSNSLTRNL